MTTEERLTSSPVSVEHTYSDHREAFSAGLPLTNAVEPRVEDSSWAVDLVTARHNYKNSVYFYGACPTYYGPDGLHMISPKSLWSFRRMGVRIRLRVQRLDFGRKSVKIPRGTLVKTEGLTAAQEGTAMQRAVLGWCAENPAFPVVIGSSET